MGNNPPETGQVIPKNKAFGCRSSFPPSPFENAAAAAGREISFLKVRILQSDSPDNLEFVFPSPDHKSRIKKSGLSAVFSLLGILFPSQQGEFDAFCAKKIPIINEGCAASPSGAALPQCFPWDIL